VRADSPMPPAAATAACEVRPESRLVILWSVRGSRSPAELADWAREQLPVLRAAPGVHEVWLRRVAPASRRWPVDWNGAFELRVGGEYVDELCDRGACGDLLADMRLLGMRPVVMLLDGDPA
jgi:hypothetical protein